MNSQIYLLSHDGCARFLRIRHWIEFFSCFHEPILKWRAAVLAPKSFEVNCTNIASISLASENAIDLYVVGSLGIIVVDITASKLIVILEALGESRHHIRFSVNFLGLSIIMDLVYTSGGGGEDEERDEKGV